MTYTYPRGTLPGGGSGAAPFDMAVFRGKVFAVGKEEDPRVLAHPLLRPYVATARLLKKERAAKLMTGLYRNHERNRKYRYNADGTIDFNEFLEMMTAKMSERDPMEEIIKAFRLFDDDETGKISFKNLKRVAKELGENMTDEELQEMIDEADRDGDGEVSEEEFIRIMKKTSLY